MHATVNKCTIGKSLLLERKTNKIISMCKKSYTSFRSYLKCVALKKKEHKTVASTFSSNCEAITVSISVSKNEAKCAKSTKCGTSQNPQRFYYIIQVFIRHMT